MNVNKREKNMLYYENITFQKFIKKEKIKMKKINKKVLFGVGAGIIAAIAGAGYLFKKKNNDDCDIDDNDSYEDEYADVDDSIESEED